MMDYFFNNKFTLSDMIDNLCLFVLYDLKYFKKSDLKIIHQELGITKTSYNFFVRLIE